MIVKDPVNDLESDLGENPKTIKNIFLDFLNRDTREIYGLFSNISDADHVGLICEMLNIAVFLCYEYCIAPPGFLLECDLARRATTDRRSEFLTERFIRLSLREDDLDKYWEKKESEYAQFKQRYSGLFKPRGRSLIKKYTGSLIKRTSKVGAEIVKSWEEGLDVNPVWDPLKLEIEPRRLEEVRVIPKLLRDTGQAVTWTAINENIRELYKASNPVPRRILQNHYFKIYIEEYGLRVLTGMPHCRDSFGLASGELYYDYDALKGALSTVEMWNLIRFMSAPNLISLRYKSGYLSFRDAFYYVTDRCRSAVEVTRQFAIVASKLKPILREARQLKRFAKLPDKVPKEGFILSDDEIDAVDFVLQAVSSKLTPSVEALSGYKLSQISEPGEAIMKLSSEQKRPNIAIFVALQMEREVLTRRWKLEGTYPVPIWRGEVGKCDFSVFSPDRIGRVPAAVLTMEFLSRVTPDMLIVVGIAGGFEAQDIQRGDVIVVDDVIDLATRKVREGEKGIIPQFKPDVFKTDSRIREYLKSSNFDTFQWEANVVSNEEWPEGRRPTIKYGDIASLDEVVSSAGWSDTLRKYWPELMGVEMEAGGVCRAAEHHKIRAAVIRGVSDLADPAKSDDEWRKLSIKTVANLLEHIEFRLIVGDSSKGAV